MIHQRLLQTFPIISDQVEARATGQGRDVGGEDDALAEDARRRRGDREARM